MRAIRLWTVRCRTRIIMRSTTGMLRASSTFAVACYTKRPVISLRLPPAMNTAFMTLAGHESAAARARSSAEDHGLDAFASCSSRRRGAADGELDRGPQM